MWGAASNWHDAVDVYGGGHDRLRVERPAGTTSLTWTMVVVAAVAMTGRPGGHRPSGHNLGPPYTPEGIYGTIPEADEYCISLAWLNGWCHMWIAWVSAGAAALPLR
jgi:hypothetical protein